MILCIMVLLQTDSGTQNTGFQCLIIRDESWFYQKKISNKTWIKKGINPSTIVRQDVIKLQR